jgi:hypothetical protein
MFQRARPVAFPFVPVLALATVLSFAVPHAEAAPCPAVGSCGGTAVTAVHLAYAQNPTMVLISMRTAAYGCGSQSPLPFSGATFICGWASTNARANDITGGCIFQSAGGENRCKVGRDGLPVELLQFGVE